LAELERSSAQELARLGVRLYRFQRAGRTAITAPEWRRLWQAYGVRRRARGA
jgi:hypothetical protein